MKWIPLELWLMIITAFIAFIMWCFMTVYLFFTHNNHSFCVSAEIGLFALIAWWVVFSFVIFKREKSKVIR